MKRNFFRMLAVVGILGLYAACSDNSTVAPKPQAGQRPLFSVSVPANGTGSCMGADALASGFTSGFSKDSTTLNCTANDISIARAEVQAYRLNDSIGVYTTLAAGDRISCTVGQKIFAITNAFLQNNATARYDIGVWIATDGGNAQTGVCNQYNLVPGSNGALSLEPSPNGDQCGDMASGAGLVKVPLDTLEIVCPAGVDTVKIGACIGWQNSDDTNQRGLCPTTPPGGSLGFRYGTVPETRSKCNCNPFPLPIDVKSSLTLVKVVTNDNGGTKTLSDFPLTATGPNTISGVSGTTDVTAAAVEAGTYALSEQTQAGYTPSSWSCVGGTQSGSNITLASGGGAATCTISNNDQPASLTLVKVVTNNNGGTKTLSDFPLTATGPNTISGVSGTTSVTGRSVNAGTYALSEQTQAGYTPSTWSCSGGTQSGANISLGLNGSATCTISNDDQTAHLTLVKVVTNNNGGTKTLSDFPLTATGPNTISGVSGTTDVTGRAVNAGSYSLSEQTQAGYTASTWSCSGGTQSGANISLGLGGSATCTISNDDIGASLTLVKVVTNNSGGTKTLSDFPLTAAGPQTISGVSGTTDVTNRGVSAGAYALSEQTQAGYTPSTWSCSGGTQSGANITLGLAGSATCTISNDDQPAHLTLVKVVTNNNGGTKTLSDFPLTAAGPQTISGVSGTTDVTNRTVNAGVYALSEQTQAGYTPSTWSCSGGTQSGSNVTLGLNGSATCTISNDDQPASLTLVKVVTNNSGGTKTLSDFPLTATGPNTISGVSGTTDVTNRGVNAGTYALSEQTQAGYTPSTWSCTGGTQSGANISLGVAGAATCTISNDDQPAHLTLVKVVTNDNGGTKTLSDFPLTATGPNTISGVSGTTDVTGRTVNAGSYALTETTQAGYAPSTWSCTGGTQSGSNIALGLNGAATCTISNNDIAPKLIIKKTVIGAGASFGFTATSAGSFITSPFTLTPPSNSSDSVVYTTTAIAGTFSVTEGTMAGYTLTDLGCSDQPVGTYDPTSTRTVIDTLSLGETVTCTFINQQHVSQTTRTQGFWATHDSLTNAVWFGGTVGGNTFAGVSDQTLCGRSLNTLPIVLGGFWSNIAKTTDGTKRTSLDQARMQLLQQLLAAILNNAAFGSTPSLMSIADAKAAYCGTDQTLIQNALNAMASFNSGGDTGAFTPGISANGKRSKTEANLTFWDILP